MDSSALNISPDHDAQTAQLLPRRLRRIYLLVVLVLAIFGVSMLHTLRTGHEMAAIHSRQVESVSRIQIEVAVAHLWFEEILTGDSNENIDSVWDHMETAQSYGDALLEGGQFDFGQIYPVVDPELRRHLETTQVQLNQFYEAARDRYELGSGAIAGSAVDQQFDEFFNSFLLQSRELNQMLHQSIERHLRDFRIVQISLLVFVLILAAGLSLVLYRYETRRVVATRMLAANEKRYRTIFDASVEGILIVDHSNNTIRYTNPTASQMLGYSDTEILGLSLAEIHLPEDREVVQNRAAGHATGDINLTSGLKYLRKDGSEFPGEVHSGPVTIDGRPHSIAFISDLSDSIQAQADKEKLEAQLRQAQKMEAVGNLAGGIAHDFNNLLQAILGYSEILGESQELSSDHRDDVGRIRLAAERAAELTRQLLAFSRRQVIAPQDLDLNGVIKDILQILERLIGEGIQLNNLAGNNLGTICVDRNQMEQIFMNLCLNARDAMEGRGTLTIETENVSIDHDYCEDHVWATPGRYVLLSITDTGHGMSPETREQIFDPFFTTKELGKGTGLGLSTVYGIVKQNSGMIHVYSEIDRGTTFKIYFPLVERPATEVGSKIARQAPGGTETILVAEDDPGVLGLAQRILGDAGYQVVTAVDGEAALKVFNTQQDSLDLALLDVVMPKLSGRDLQLEMCRIRPDFKVIFASGYSENAIHTDFVLNEGNTLIEKPYRRNDLLIKIREILDA
jgi:PAS domain S-box-containing protein